MNAPRPARRRLSALALLALAGSGLTGAQSPAAQATAQVAVVETVRVAIAGDVCGSACNQTDDVVAAMGADAVLVPGDLAYESGKLSEFNGSYDTYWGQFNDIVKPVPGNHEYQTTGASGYFDYFEGKSVAVGERGKGYYSFDLGAWHIVALNSNVASGAGSTQETWLRNDLAATNQPCTLAYWHHARFSSGDHGDNTTTSALWKALTDAKADLVVQGHDHHYERFAPAMSNGTTDTTNGLSSFVIGTAGRALYSATNTSSADSEVFNNNTFGVGQFDLSATGWSMEFKPVAGRTFTDSATGTCKTKGSTGSTVTVTNPGNRTATVGTATSLQVQASSTAGGALTYSAAGLPAGLSIAASTGLVSGTPTTAGTSNVTVTARDSSGTTGSASFTWTVNPASGGGSVLTNGVAVTGLSGSAGTDLRYTLEVPAGATGLSFVQSGGTGDADLHVRFGSAPTTATYDCRPYKDGNEETCSFATPQAGTYHVLVRGYTSFSGVTLTGKFTPGGSGGGTSFFENTTDYTIADLGSATSPITVSRTGSAPSTLQVKVSILHTYSGDLVVELIAPDGTVRVLQSKVGGGTDDIVKTFTVDASSELAAGTWKLRVTDTAKDDSGRIDAWSLQF